MESISTARPWRLPTEVRLMVLVWIEFFKIAATQSSQNTWLFACGTTNTIQKWTRRPPLLLLLKSDTQANYSIVFLIQYLEIYSFSHAFKMLEIILRHRSAVCAGIFAYVTGCNFPQEKHTWERWYREPKPEKKYKTCPTWHLRQWIAYKIWRKPILYRSGSSERQNS